MTLGVTVFSRAWRRLGTGAQLAIVIGTLAVALPVGATVAVMYAWPTADHLRTDDVLARFGDHGIAERGLLADAAASPLGVLLYRSPAALTEMGTTEFSVRRSGEVGRYDVIAACHNSGGSNGMLQADAVTTTEP